MKNKLTILLSLLLSSFILKAAPIKISGKVLSNGKGITNVPVTDGSQIVYTDKNGNYHMSCDDDSKYVYLSIPNGYEVDIVNDTPCFYKKISRDSRKDIRYDFNLKKSNKDNSKHILVVWADPQVYFDDEIKEVEEAAEDVKELLNKKYNGVSAIGVCCGDMIGDMDHKPLLFEPLNKAICKTGIPFFYVKGNHDINTGVRSNDLSSDTYNEIYGPSYYSFDFGQIHYVVLDDVFFIGKSTNYIGYLDEKQLKWLELDLNRIEPGRCVVVITHIPTYSREARHQEWSKESLNKVLNNRKALYNILKPYDAHIMSGHEHYNENYVFSDSLYEHVHAPLSNLFWCAPWACDGTPGGYAVYEMDSKVSNWYYKGIGYPEEIQFELYPSGRMKNNKDAIVVNVWNYDNTWKVYWYEDGINKGEMIRYTGYDPNIAEYCEKNSTNFKHKYIGAGVTEHLFYAIPSSNKSIIKIEAIDHNGNKYTKQINNSKVQSE